MDVKVVTDLEREIERGLGPDRGSGVVTSREELLLPFSTRERACVCALADVCRELDKSEADADAVQRTVRVAFAQTVGVAWPEVRRFWESSTASAAPV